MDQKVIFRVRSSSSARVDKKILSGSRPTRVPGSEISDVPVSEQTVDARLENGSHSPCMYGESML